MTIIDCNKVMSLQVLQSLSTYKLTPDQAADAALDLLTGLPPYASTFLWEAPLWSARSATVPTPKFLSRKNQIGFSTDHSA